MAPNDEFSSSLQALQPWRAAPWDGGIFRGAIPASVYNRQRRRGPRADIGGDPLGGQRPTGGPVAGLALDFGAL